MFKFNETKIFKHIIFNNITYFGWVQLVLLSNLIICKKLSINLKELEKVWVTKNWDLFDWVLESISIKNTNNFILWNIYFFNLNEKNHLKNNYNF